AVDPDGHAVVVWQRFNGTYWRIQARRRSKGGALSLVQTLSDGGHAFHPQVAVDQDGDAVVVWYRFDGTKNRIQARRRSKTGALSFVQTVSGAGRHHHHPQVAMDQGGDAVIVWQRFDGAKWEVQARKRWAGGLMGPVTILGGSWAGHGFYPQVAVAQDGDAGDDAVFVWQCSDKGKWHICSRRGLSSAGLIPLVISGSGEPYHATQPQVAVDEDGGTVIVWKRSDGTNFRIQARRRSVAGPFDAVQTLSSSGQHASSPQVAVDESGDAVAVWQRSDGTNQRVESVGL
ncbi:MAG: hypothetical protein M3245_06355, partial [Actinomycetota bacterium]|nr:hypothetical protein [Actinomycetota bacterium]